MRRFDFSKYTIVPSVGELQRLIEKLSQKTLLAVDTETTSLNFMEAEIVGISLADGSGMAWYIPLGHMVDPIGFKNLPIFETQKILKPFFESDRILFIGHNYKYDRHILTNNGFASPKSFGDTQLLAHSFNMQQRFKLDLLVKRYFDHEMVPIKDLIKIRNRYITFDKVPIDEAGPYAAEDADATIHLYNELCTQGTKKQHDLYTDYAIPFSDVLWSMEQEGVRVDVDYLNKLSTEYKVEAEKAYDSAMSLIREPINLNSPRQMAVVLFDELGLKPTKMAKTGPSTDKSVLEGLAKEHDFPKLVLKYRELKKLDSTYAEALPKVADVDGRIHTSFNQCGTATGRLSSSSPNLQNIPIRSEEGAKLRRAFVAKPGHLFIGADYSQIELRIMAHFSQDERLIKAYQNDEDIHALTASQVFSVPLKDITKELRARAKTINFGLIYGMSAQKFARDFKISMDLADMYLKRYFEVYPGIQHFKDSCVRFARKNGYIYTMLGARRYLPNINNRKDRALRGKSERLAGNTPIQGTAADIIKVAMIDIHREVLEATLLLQVHDEILLEVEEAFAERIKDDVERYMKQAAIDVGLDSVPVEVDAKIGKTWADAH